MQEQFDNLRKGRSRVLVKKHTLIVGYQREKVLSIIQVCLPDLPIAIDNWIYWSFFFLKELKVLCEMRNFRSCVVILSNESKEKIESDIND